jgi:hypothetical protein
VRIFVTLVALATALGACSSGGSAFGVDDVVSALEDRGATVSVQPSPHDSIAGITGSGHILCVDGYEAIILEYDDEAARQTEIDEDPPDQARNLDICWGRLGWWTKGDVVIYFHYDPAHPGSVAALFDDVLGPSIGRTGRAFTEAPTEIPPSDRCG